MKRFVPQSGMGIEVRHGSLYAYYGRRLWGGFREAGRLEIPEYEQLGAPECGRRYHQFLRQHGLKAPWTTVVLPRSRVLLRLLRFPRAVEKDLAQAVELQADSLHPFEPGSVVWDCAEWKPVPTGKGNDSAGRMPAGELAVLVAMAQQREIESLAEWFREAQIPVSQFSPAPLLLLALLADSIAAQLASGEPYFLLHATAEGFELIGCTANGGWVSREILLTVDQPQAADQLIARIDQELRVARAELRLEPEERPRLRVCGTGWLPDAVWDSGELPFRCSRAEAELPRLRLLGAARGDIAGVAAAAAAAMRPVPLALNLLPESARSFEPSLAAAPTYALAAVVILLAMAMGARGSVQDWLYSRYLEREQLALQPEIRQLEQLHQANQQTWAQLAALDAIRRSGALPLDLLDELTRLLPADVWLQQLQYENRTVTMSGTASSASAVLQAVATSNYLEAAQLTSAVTRTPEGKEIFRIGARLRVPNP